MPSGFVNGACQSLINGRSRPTRLLTEEFTVGFGAASVLFGLILLVASIALFLLDRIKPELHRETDNIYAVMGVICSVFMIGGGLNPTHGVDVAFVNMILSASAISLMWQTVATRESVAPAKSGRRNNNGSRPNYRPERQEADNQYRPYRATMDDTQELEPARGNRNRNRRLDRDENFDTYGESGNRRKRLPQGTSGDSWQDNNDSDWERDERRESIPRPERKEPDNRDRRSTRAAEREDRFNDDLERGNSGSNSSSSRNDDDLAPRRRKRNSRPKDAEGSMSGYVDYEPVDGSNDGSY
jgi:hypothetical protein